VLAHICLLHSNFFTFVYTRSCSSVFICAIRVCSYSCTPVRAHACVTVSLHSSSSEPVYSCPCSPAPVRARPCSSMSACPRFCCTIFFARSCLSMFALVCAHRPSLNPAVDNVTPFICRPLRLAVTHAEQSGVLCFYSCFASLCELKALKNSSEWSIVNNNESEGMPKIVAVPYFKYKPTIPVRIAGVLTEIWISHQTFFRTALHSKITCNTKRPPY
jgi:hypothetical protein